MTRPGQSHLGWQPLENRYQKCPRKRTALAGPGDERDCIIAAGFGRLRGDFYALDKFSASRRRRISSSVIAGV